MDLSALNALPPSTPVFLVLAAVLALFVWDRWRFEAVALGALLVLVAAGAVEPLAAFHGMGHPAVITVAAVLVISRALENAGVVELVSRPILGIRSGGVALQVFLLTSLVAVLSGFMNNVGALALLLPVAIRLCRERDIPPSLLLMPMAFASLLGGLLTAIGTPPNLIVAQYRGGVTDDPFAMFDFLPVGAALMIVGIAFLSLAGWRLLPRRDGAAGDNLEFTIDDYVAEVRVPEKHEWFGRTLREVAEDLGDDAALLGLLREDRRIPIQHHQTRLHAGDVLVVEAEAEALKSFVEKNSLQLVGREESHEDLRTEGDVQLVEVVVPLDSRLVSRTAGELGLRWRFGINLLAISRQGSRLHARLSRVRLAAGDVLLVEGEREAMGETLSTLGCLPLADRDLTIGQPRRVLLGAVLFGGAIAAAALGWLTIHVSFVACVLLMAGTGMIGARDAYRAIDWPIVLLLGAMIPVGSALESSGGAALIANALGGLVQEWPPVWALAALLVVTMCLSDVINNAAAAVLMCPIAAGLARQIDASVDPFLMAVAVGASCAFLTPVGHQSNTLVLGPGGYRFRDYWPLGLPLQAAVGVVAVLAIPKIWPL